MRGLQNFNEKCFSRRPLAYKIASLIPDNSKVLDVGCNDGTTSLMLLEKSPSLQLCGVDIQSNRACKIPKQVYDGKYLPCESNSFDVVIALDVLHHTNHIEGLLKEMARVAKNVVILKDHACGNYIEYLALSVLDYIGNEPYGIPCVYNYPSYARWDEYFSSAGLRKNKVIPFGSWWYNKLQPVFILQKLHDG